MGQRGTDARVHLKLAWRKTQPYAVVGTAIVNIFFGGAPYETLYWVGETQGGRAVLGGGGRMRAVPLGPSVEPPYGATKRRIG